MHPRYKKLNLHYNYGKKIRPKRCDSLLDISTLLLAPSKFDCNRELAEEVFMGG